MNIIINSPQKADCFAFLFQHIKMFTDHINIMFENERMYIQTMDNSRVSILEINIPKNWFDSYEVSKGVTIGINANILFRVLNARERSQIITINFKEENNDKLNVHFTSDNKEEFDKHFEISLIDIDSETMNIPEIEYQAEFTLGSANFANIINQLKTFGESLEINCSEEKILLTSSSIDQGKMSCEIKMDDLTSYAIEEGESIKSGFSLNYLHNICLYNKLSKEIEIKISADYPMKIVYNLIGSDTAKMTFFLAPKIGDETGE